MTTEPTRTATGIAPWLAVCLAASAALCGCNGGNPAAPLPPSGNPHEWLEVSRSLTGVRGLLLDVPVVCDLRIEQGAAESIWLRADETVIAFLGTTVRDGILEIRYPFEVDPAKRPPKPFQVVLTVVDLEHVELLDGGTITASDLSVDRLVLRSSGRGAMDFAELSAQELEVEVLAGGPVAAQGEVDRQRATLAGFGAYDGGDLRSREARVEISSHGSATIRVDELLRATISGSGSVYYYGDPVVESSITGSGQIVRLGD